MLGRQFVDGHREELDTRLWTDGDFSPQAVELSLPRAAGLPISWAVLYQRADLPPGMDADLAIFETIELASGRLGEAP